MKPALINGRWPLILPNHLADWDALTGWEFARFESMERHLDPDMTLWDVGTEHGALSAVYQSFVSRMALIEPSAAMWRNIRQTWDANNLPDPLFTFVGLLTDAADSYDDGQHRDGVWPACAYEPGECPAMPYRYLHTGDDTPRSTLDLLMMAHIAPVDAVTIDVEGAELLVLEGAKRMLTVRRPLVWVSIHPDLIERDYGATDAAVHDYMASVGYSGHYLGTDHEEHWIFRP